MAYASYNRGFKSGGFNDYLSPQTYQPEVLDAYEIGVKSDLFDRRLQFNAAFFYYDYKNIQAVEYPQGTEVIRNAAEARLYGVDIDVKAIPFAGLTMTAGFEYLHDRFTSFPDATIAVPVVPGGGTAFTRGDVAGNRLGFAPDYMLSVGVAYELLKSFILPQWGRVSSSLNWSHNDSFFAEPENRLRQPAYDVVNARIEWALPDDRTKIVLWGNNLTQAVYTVALASQDSGDFAIYAPPRTYGFKIEQRF
jgi:iron complex outermembrane receptor protein